MTHATVSLSKDAGNLRGIAAISAGMASLAVNDLLMKLAGATLPIGELMLVRGLFASLLIGVICYFSGALKHIGQMLEWQVSGRALANVAAGVCYLTAIINMPIANVTAMMQASPLMLTALAALVLGERVGWRRWVAIAVGFCGVLLIVRPASSGFSTYSLFALGAICFVSMRDLFTKVVKADTPSMIVTFATSLVSTAGGGLLCLYQGWVDLGAKELAFLIPAAFVSVAGYHFVIVGFRSGEVGVVAPFRFSLVLWATLGGYFIWGEFPDVMTVLGIGLIVCMGIYTFHRERLRRAGQEPLSADTKREI